jgi:hypothetical protein
MADRRGMGCISKCFPLRRHSKLNILICLHMGNISDFISKNSPTRVPSQNLAKSCTFAALAFSDGGDTRGVGERASSLIELFAKFCSTHVASPPSTVVVSGERSIIVVAHVFHMSRHNYRSLYTTPLLMNLFFYKLSIAVSRN